eukprot:365756-Chlamydomonas_euryale.AAC.12
MHQWVVRLLEVLLCAAQLRTPRPSLTCLVLPVRQCWWEPRHTVHPYFSARLPCLMLLTDSDLSSSARQCGCWAGHIQTFWQAYRASDQVWGRQSTSVRLGRTPCNAGHHQSLVSLLPRSPRTLSDRHVSFILLTARE